MEGSEVLPFLAMMEMQAASCDAEIVKRNLDLIGRWNK